jgi:hypothetical protein
MSEAKEQKQLNIYQKLQKCRVELQKSDMKKSGENKFSHYTYFELSDFLPKINELMDKHNLTAIFSFTLEEAALTIINTERPEETIAFKTPVTVAELKGCYGIQNIGATQTYARRYLYVMAFEIAESDALDKTEADEEQIYKSKKIDAIKIETINSMLEKTKSDKKIFLNYYKLKSVEDITNGAFIIIMKTLQDKLDKMEKDKPVDLGI